MLGRIRQDKAVHGSVCGYLDTFQWSTPNTCHGMFGWFDLVTFMQYVSPCLFNLLAGNPKSSETIVDMDLMV